MQERRAAARIGGSTTPGSGNQWHSKNDVRTPIESVELKTTTKDSFSLKAEDLHKVVANALIDGARFGWMEIEFANRGVTAVVLDADDFYAMRYELHKLRESGTSELE